MSLDEFLTRHPKSHLMFDFDETLFWLVLEWGKFDGYVRSHLAPLDDTLAQKYFAGHSLSDTLNAYISTYGDKAKTVINELSLDFEKNHLTRVVPNPELVAFVRQNKDRYRMDIWTSNTSRIVQEVLDRNDLTEIFTNIASQLEVRLLKPYPDGFFFLRQQEVPLENCLMIGNSKADERAARAAGIDYFHVDYFTKRPQAD